HVEFQIFGDARGDVVHLFERDCSIQRRHQKVVEETPAPRYGDELRQRMAQAAVAAARGVHYRNAGTVEFIVTPENDFYFLEMNTRLQVEHPITEQVVGVDLVRAQIDVAGGKPLPWRQEELRQRGHAIEVRVYAEDPDDRFLPQSGTIAFYRQPAGPGVRVDAGVGEGTQIGVSFDPMLAKLICHAPTRDLCIDRLERALRDYVILGTKTNVSWLRRVIAHPAFRQGKQPMERQPAPAGLQRVLRRRGHAEHRGAEQRAFELPSSEDDDGKRDEAASRRHVLRESAGEREREIRAGDADQQRLDAE